MKNSNKNSKLHSLKSMALTAEKARKIKGGNDCKGCQGDSGGPMGG